ncbi:hypothetical protein ABZ705_19285 [Streptomyces sp. NPDC006984]|uniref:hypothetical protein n=1 Tax=Streptomyces sp. NPDC006984 TaxID=3155463 RepID=UPI0033E70246
MNASTTRRRFGQFTLVATAAALLTPLDAGVANAAEASETPTSSPAAYINYLENTSEIGADQTLKDFKALDAIHQKRYLNYLNDPDVFEDLLEEAADGSAPPNTKSLSDTGKLSTTDSATSEGGDIVLEKETNATFVPDAPLKGQLGTQALSRGTWTSHYTVSQKIFGITVTKLKAEVNYYTTGRKVTRVNWANGQVRNFNAVVAISKGIPKAWLSGGTAYGQVTWEGSIVYKGFGIQLDKVHRVWANHNGYQGGYLRNV